MSAAEASHSGSNGGEPFVSLTRRLQAPPCNVSYPKAIAPA
jgi:hypothetical protein